MQAGGARERRLSALAGSPSCRLLPEALGTSRPVEPRLGVTVIAHGRAPAVPFDVVTWNASLHPHGAAVGGPAVNDVEDVRGWVEGPATPEEDHVSPQVFAVELCCRHVFHHRLDGGVRIHYIRGVAVPSPVIGVGELGPGGLGALTGVELEGDVA